jgi:hypothetical protein
MVGHSGTHWTFFALGKQVSWHPLNGRLPLSRGAGVPLFDRAVEGSPTGGLGGEH